MALPPVTSEQTEVQETQPLAARGSPLGRVARNTLYLLSSDVVNRGTTFVLFALVGRYLGAYEFGQLALALSLFFTFQVFALAGLKTLVIRQVAKDRSLTDRYLVNGSATVFVSTAVSFGILLLFIRVMGYSDDTAGIILLVCLGILPYALAAICEGIFTAWERMRFIAFVNAPINIFKVSAAFALLSAGYGLPQLIGLLLVCYVATMILSWALLLRYITRPRFRLDPAFGASMLRQTSMFLGIDGIIAILASVNVVILSRLATEREVGLYNSAFQFITPVQLLFVNIVISVFPIMARKFEDRFENLRGATERLLELLMVIGLPTALGIFLLADRGLVFLYGDADFADGATVLRIIVWIVILRAVIHVLGQVLISGMRERITLRIVFVDLVVNTVLCIVLTQRYGLTGAAVAALVAAVVDLVQHYLAVSRLMAGIQFVRLFWKPVVAGLVMTGALLVLRLDDLLASAVVGAAIYGAVLLALLLLTVGGLRSIRAYYLYGTPPAP